MKTAFALLALVLCSCQTGGGQGASQTALLTFPAKDYLYFPGTIFAIDDQPPSKQSPYLLSAGSHKISYGCPDILYADHMPSIVVDLEANRSYQLHCRDNKAVLELQD